MLSKVWNKNNSNGISIYEVIDELTVNGFDIYNIVPISYIKNSDILEISEAYILYKFKNIGIHEW